MKKKAWLAIAGVIGMASCQSPDSDVMKTGHKQYPVRFNLQLKKEILPFPSVRSIPDCTISDPVDAKSTPEDEGSLYSKIEYMVYNCSETPEKLVRQKHFISTDDDFGIIYDSLPAGEYKMAFLAHSSEVATLSGNMIDLDKVSDVFYVCEAISISTDNILKDIDLKRIVSRIEFISEQAVPATLKSFKIEVKPYFNRINIFTGEGASQTDVFTFPYLLAEYKEVSNPTHSFYTFIPAGNETISAYLTATSNDGTEYKRTVDNITPVSNKIIRYKGILYTPKNPDETFKLNIIGDGAWDTPDGDIPLE